MPIYSSLHHALHEKGTPCKTSTLNDSKKPSSLSSWSHDALSQILKVMISQATVSSKIISFQSVTGEPLEYIKSMKKNTVACL